MSVYGNVKSQERHSHAEANVSDLLQPLQRSNLEGAEYLLFNPKRDIYAIPRYLFRVFTPYSQGTTHRYWVKSMAAKDGLASSRTDIFSREDKQRAADMLARHLQWEKNLGDNMVSWTASLLFALVYIFHLRASIHSKATLDEIQLLVVDTSSFPEGVFMRDLDLTSDFSSIDRNLQNHKRLRSKQTSGLYYDFGEYLSQGALRIDDRCQIVSARSIINSGLCDIRPEFKEFSNWKRGPESARWASAVLEMRVAFYCDDTERPGISEKGMLAALRIAIHFEPHFRVPIVANLVALAAPRVSDLLVLSECIKSSPITDDREQFAEELTCMATCYTMPEMQEYGSILQSIYEIDPKPTIIALDKFTSPKVLENLGPSVTVFMV